MSASAKILNPIMKIVLGGHPSSVLSHFECLAKCLGIDSQTPDAVHGGLPDAMARAAASASDLTTMKDVATEAEWSKWVENVEKTQTKVLLLAPEPGETVDGLVNILTRGAVRRVKSIGRIDRVSFPATSRPFSGDLAGFSFASEAEDALGLELGPNAETIMKVGGVPAFVHVKVGHASVFVWATRCVFDMLRPLTAEKEFELALDQYIPGIVFLRTTFSDRCWHNPAPGAGIVIDDPLLKKNYGFISFGQLLMSARKNGYHVTLAFIPWNYWRTSRAEARFFEEYSDCFGICAHGCDHTNMEFGSSDYADLLSRNFLASERMKQHAGRTGLASEPLMVCPQEQYSAEAMRAFADSRQFLGLVCTACMPRNLTSPEICGADLLLPAQDSFFGFPIFKRHYWSDISVFAMSLFLGKPAVLVEHQEFFRNGPAGLEDFVAGLAKMRPELGWTSLAQMARRTHWRRREAMNREEIRFFTDDFEFEHKGEETTEYALVRRISGTQVRCVTVNGEERPFIQKNGWLTLELKAKNPQALRIRVDVNPVSPTSARPGGLTYSTSVACRRVLSEFRDKVIARNGFALRTARLLAKAMKQTAN